jgi:hypothetical protein
MLLRAVIVGSYWWALLNGIIEGRYAVLRRIVEGRFCGTLLQDVIVGRHCGMNYGGTYRRALLRALLQGIALLRGIIAGFAGRYGLLRLSRPLGP